MALMRRLKAIYDLQGVAGIRASSSYSTGSSRDFARHYSNGLQRNSHVISSGLYKGYNVLPSITICSNMRNLRSTMAVQLLIFTNDKRLATTQVKPTPQVRQQGSFGIVLSSPGFIYEPYAPRDRISFWQRWFTRSGWRRTKEDLIIEFRSAYAIQKLRKAGYSKSKFYQEAFVLYKEINTILAKGDKNAIRKFVTEKMHSALKNEIKQRESKWNNVYWELIEPVVKIRTLRARAIGVDQNDLNKVFVQLTLEFLAKQKFEAYDTKGAVVAGDKTKEVLVRDIWVFEKSLFHQNSQWRLCGRITA